MKRVIAAMVAALTMVALVASTALAGYPPITATGAVTDADDIGSCTNVWATIDLTKVYKLTLTKSGAYNLEIKEDGPFTTIAGLSPGACAKIVTPPGNGNTVVAGISGMTHQTFNAIVTAATEPVRTPACAAPCATSRDFLDAVFPGGWSMVGGFSWTAHYTTGSHGTYFDTSVNWPRNNRGDIN